MKKLFSALIAALLLMLATAPAVMAGNVTMYVKTPNGKCLLVRSKADKEGKVLYTLPYGCSVKVREASVSKTWAHLAGHGKHRGGYVMNKYLVDERPAEYDGSHSPAMENMEAVETQFTVLVNPARKGGTANLRLYADKTSKLLDKMVAGAELTVIAESEKWYQVKTADGKEGYVYKQYTKLPEAAVTPGAA